MDLQNLLNYLNQKFGLVPTPEQQVRSGVLSASAQASNPSQWIPPGQTGSVIINSPGWNTSDQINSFPGGTTTDTFRGQPFGQTTDLIRNGVKKAPQLLNDASFFQRAFSQFLQQKLLNSGLEQQTPPPPGSYPMVDPNYQSPIPNTSQYNMLMPNGQGIFGPMSPFPKYANPHVKMPVPAVLPNYG